MITPNDYKELHIQIAAQPSDAQWIESVLRQEGYNRITLTDNGWTMGDLCGDGKIQIVLFGPGLKEFELSCALDNLCQRIKRPTEVLMLLPLSDAKTRFAFDYCGRNPYFVPGGHLPPPWAPNVLVAAVASKAIRALQRLRLLEAEIEPSKAVKRYGKKGGDHAAPG